MGKTRVLGVAVEYCLILGDQVVFPPAYSVSMILQCVKEQEKAYFFQRGSEARLSPFVFSS